MAQQGSATPQLFGAPSPSDPASGFNASVSSAQASAQMQVQATQQAMGQILQSLQFALTMKERRTQQAQEIEAANRLETLRQDRSDSRMREEQGFMQSRADATNAAEYERARLRERGETFRQNRSFARGDQQFALKYGQDERRLALDASEAQARALEMRRSWQAKKAGMQADFGRSLLPLALSMQPFEPGAVPGTYKVRDDFMSAGGPIGGAQPSLGGQASMLQQAGQALGGPQGAAMQGTGQAITAGMPALGDELRKKSAEGNDLAVEQAKLQGRQGGPSSGSVVGLLPISAGALDNVGRTLGISLQLGSLQTAVAAGPSIVYNPATKRIEAVGQATPEVQSAVELLNSRAKQIPDALHSLVGGSVNPFLPQQEVLEIGRNLVAGNPETLVTSPQGGGAYQNGSRPTNEERQKRALEQSRTSFLSVKPPGGAPQQQGAPVAPAPTPGQASGKAPVSEGAANMAREAVNAEAQSREAASKYLSWFGVGPQALGQPFEPPPETPESRELARRFAAAERRKFERDNYTQRRVRGGPPPKPAEPAPAAPAGPKVTTTLRQTAPPEIRAAAAARAPAAPAPQPARPRSSEYATLRLRATAAARRANLPAAELARVANSDKAMLDWLVSSLDPDALAAIEAARAERVIDDATASAMTQRLRSAQSARRSAVKVRDR